MAGFHIPEAGSTVSLSMALADVMGKYPHYFREDVKIASFFGSPPVIWNGGRLMVGSWQPEYIKEVIRQYNERGIPYRFTFTNPHIKEEHLGDRRGNYLLDMADNGMNEVIVNSPVLEEYIRKTHPDMKITSSTCKCIRDMNGVKAELAKDYNLVVLDFNFNNNFEELEKLTHEERKRCEILCNAFCIPGCPRRAEHYDSIGRYQIEVISGLEQHGNYELATKNVKEWQCDYHGGNPYEKEHSQLWVEPEAVYEKYVPMGFENFKLEGRGVNMAVLADEAAHFMAKPEYVGMTVHRALKSAIDNMGYNYV